MIPLATRLPRRLAPALLAAVLAAAALLAWLGYRDPELMLRLGDLPLCR
jgi:hypothetical protein